MINLILEKYNCICNCHMVVEHAVLIKKQRCSIKGIVIFMHVFLLIFLFPRLDGDVTLREAPNIRWGCYRCFYSIKWLTFYIIPIRCLSFLQCKFAMMVKAKKWLKLLSYLSKKCLKKILSQVDLSWIEVCCTWDNKIDLVVAIPIDRVDDFKRWKYFPWSPIQFCV